MAEVVTGEAVVLDVPCARFPSRIGAVLIDLVIQLSLLAAVALAVLAASGSMDAATAAAIGLTSYVVVVVGYPTAFETLTRGKTPGKMAFGLRVIGDDGSPVRFRQALVRALTGAIEIWSIVFAPIGLITSMVSVQGKRLGDMFAGTYVIQERAPGRPDLPPPLTAVPPPLLGWARVAEISRLSDQNAEAASSYLRRLHELSPAARGDLGVRIATATAAQVSPPPPPGTPPAAYLAAVLALRRERELAWLASQRAVPGDGAPGDGAACGAAGGGGRGEFGGRGKFGKCGSAPGRAARGVRGAAGGGWAAPGGDPGPAPAAGTPPEYSRPAQGQPEQQAQPAQDQPEQGPPAQGPAGESLRGPGQPGPAGFAPPA